MSEVRDTLWKLQEQMESLEDRIYIYERALPVLPEFYAESERALEKKDRAKAPDYEMYFKSGFIQGRLEAMNEMAGCFVRDCGGTRQEFLSAVYGDAGEGSGYAERLASMIKPLQTDETPENEDN